ncbi:MAG: DUF92 domain-containing protein [Thermoanaerobaculia bacterium]
MIRSSPGIMAHETNETLRKFLHITFGLFAVTLLWIPWRIAAGIAVLAMIGNWLVLHRLVGARVARHERGYDPGIVIYPAAVAILIVMFNWHLEIAAAAWILMAFGDGSATLVGRAMPIRPLPWNREKSWGGLLAFIVVGGIAAGAIAHLFHAPSLIAIAIATVVTAMAETLPLGVNDNITVPAVAAGVLAAFAIRPMMEWETYPPIAWPWLAVNTVLPIAGYAIGGVDLSGAIAGWILGSMIVLGGGPPMYTALLAFFVIGTACTKLGYEQKSKEGLAQERGGRRGAAHAVAKVGVATLCAIACWRGLGLVPLFMGITSLATATADTVGSEIGQLIGRRAFMPLTFRRVERGTEGAISIEGTLTGALAGFVVAALGVAMAAHHLAPGFMGSVEIVKTHTIAVITACAVLGSYFESILGSFRFEIANSAMNFINTAAGAVLFWIAWHFVPMFGFSF